METTEVSLDGYMDKEIVLYINNGILFKFLKKGTPAICDNMDKHGGHHTKWNTSVTEEQILYDSTYMKYLKQSMSKKWKGDC